MGLGIMMLGPQSQDVIRDHDKGTGYIRLGSQPQIRDEIGDHKDGVSRES